MKKYSLERRRIVLGYILVIPSILIIVFVLLYPLLYALYMSFFRVTVGRGLSFNFVGFKNYVDVLFDSSWWGAFRNTGIFVLSDVFVGIPLGFISALALNRRLKLKGLIIGVVLLPYVMPPIVVSLIWKWIYNTDYGFLNAMLVQLGLIENNIAWLSSPRIALVMLIIANLWVGTPFATIIYLGGMKSIPVGVYESARIEGANVRQLVRFITIPLLKPFTHLLIVMKMIYTFKIFEFIYAITGGGPAGSTNVVSLKIYQTAFEAFRFGRASAMSFILLGVVFILVLLVQGAFRSDQEII